MGARAFVLNLDAELELAAAGRYAPTRAMAARVDALGRSLGMLLRPSDQIVSRNAPPASALGLEGHAFCMTPQARERLERAGAVPIDTPSASVLRRVNHRRFCVELGETLPGATFATTVVAVEEAVAALAGAAGALLKRPLSFAGRGQRRVRGCLDDADRAWLRATPIESGVRVEPRLTLLVEHTVHGILAPDGGLRLGPVQVQEVDPSGVWRAARPVADGELTPHETQSALEEATRVGTALTRAGYFGPFGVDGFIYSVVAPGGGRERRQQVRGEINARYTMGWSLGPPP